MANMVEPRGAADDSADESELTSLVRRWMDGSRVERGRRDGPLRVAPGPAPSVPPQPVPAQAVAPQPVPLQPAAALEVDVHDEPAELAEPAEPPQPAPAPAGDVEPEPEPRAPALPHRPSAAETEHATRVAVLIDARRVSEDVASGLLARLDDRGTVNVCRAYADWTRADLGAWVGRLRRQGLHSFHQFADDDDQALVAMAIDAVDIAREASVDEVVIAGDMTSMLPLVHRLHAAGVRVVVVGPVHTPHDVRAACDEFLDAGVLAGERPVVTGRHRA